MLLEHQISLEWFLNDHVTLKTGVMTAENSALPSLIFFFLLILQYFKSNKCSLGSIKDFFQNRLKSYQPKTFEW